jgi:tetratricopeptide (TPR) repeat protein
MRQSGTLEEALEIVKKSQRGGGFGLVIADGKEGTAKGIEATKDLLGIRNMRNSSIIMTNFALTSELKKVDLLVRYGLMMRNIEGRYVRLEDLVRKNHGRITPSLVAEFMSDRMDAVSGTERGTGNTVCNQTNVTSVVFQPRTGYFWVATGKEPVCGNKYIKFDFNAELDGLGSTVNPETLPGYRWENDSHHKGINNFMKAIISFKENHQDLQSILAHLQSSLEADPHEPIYFKNKARIMIHEGRYEKAQEILSRSLWFIQTNNERAQAFLLMGQACDLAGSRKEAVYMYQKVIDAQKTSGNDHASRLNHFVYAYANKYLNKPFSTEDINDIPILSEILD